MIGRSLPRSTLLSMRMDASAREATISPIRQPVEVSQLLTLHSSISGYSSMIGALTCALAWTWQPAFSILLTFLPVSTTK